MPSGFTTPAVAFPSLPQTKSPASQENKMTVTLIAVVVLFLCCQTPTAIFLIYSPWTGNETDKKQINLSKGKRSDADKFRTTNGIYYHDDDDMRQLGGRRDECNYSFMDVVCVISIYMIH